MTQIDFYVQVDDRLETARKLCAKALAAGTRLVVWCADPSACGRFSRLLWSVPATGFMPHCLCGDALASRTPIILACEDGVFPHDQVLINLGPEVPAVFSRFGRLIEIVASGDDADKEPARDRFRFYRNRGYPIRTHDMSRAASAAADG